MLWLRLAQDLGNAPPSYVVSVLDQEESMNHDPSNWEHAVKWSAASLYGGMLYTSVAFVQPLTFVRYSEHRIGEGLSM